MKTRVGKIARLDYQTREQLNLRLLNGELGAPLLKWLNELPDTIQTVAELFAGKPITKQNLSEWRHGGYEDWLRHQKRQENFQQMNEQGEELRGDEGSQDLFENFSRLVLAEMAEDLNTLHEITNPTERWKRLREISRDLARLQHSYNHSRKVELSFHKWRHDTGIDERVVPNQPREQKAAENAAPAPEINAVAPSPTESQQENAPVDDPIRTIHCRRCRSGCVCKDCHPDDGKYPYAQAVKDYAETWKPEYRSVSHYPLLMKVACACPCDECAKNELQQLDTVLVQAQPSTP